MRVQRSSVRFVASQPWPMPRSLMVGFHAEAIDSTTNTRTMDVADLADTKGAKKGTNLRVDKDGDGAMGGAEGGGALAGEGLSEEGRAAAGAVGITEVRLSPLPRTTNSLWLNVVHTDTQQTTPR